MACFGAPARDTWASRGEHHEHPARAQRPIKRRQAQVDVFNNWEAIAFRTGVVVMQGITTTPVLKAIVSSFFFSSSFASSSC